MNISRAAVTRGSSYIVAALACIGFYLLLRFYPMDGSETLHTLLEVVAAMAAGAVGVIARVRYYSKKNAAYLFISTGFIGTALLDSFHALITYSPLETLTLFPSTLSALTSWSWLASRLFLAAMLSLSWLTWHFDSARQEETEVFEAKVYITSVLLGLATLLIFFLVPLPDVYLEQYHFARPAEFVPGLLFLGALFAYLHKGWWRTNAFEHWLILSLIVGMMTQMLIMPASHELFDSMHTGAHLTKIASYLFVLVGLLISMSELFKSAEKSAGDLRNANEILQDEITERLKAEHALQQNARLLSQVIQAQTEIARVQLDRALVMKMVAQRVVDLAQADGAFFALERDGRLEVMVASGVAESLVGRAFSLEETLAGGCFADAQFRWHSDAQAVHYAEARALDAKSLMAVPLIFNNETVGILEIVALPPSAFSDATRDMAQLLSGLVAAAMAHSSAFETKQQLLEERTVALETLKQTQAHTRLIIETAYDAFVAMDAEGRIVDWNHNAETIFGWRREEVLGRLLADTIIPPQYREGHTRGLDRYLASGVATVLNRRLELTGLRRDGGQFPVELTITPVTLGHGPVFNAFMRDITERKSAERALQSEREFLNAVLDNVQDAIVACDASGTLSLFNRSARELHGVGQEPLPPEQWPQHYALYRPDGNTAMPAEEVPLLRAFHGEKLTAVEMMVGKRGEPKKSLLASGQPVYTPDGAKLGAVVTMHDISEQKEAEEALRRANEDLEQRVDARTQELSSTNARLQQEIEQRKRSEARLAQQAKELSRSNKELEQFAYVASHDLQEPLRMVASYTQLLARRQDAKLDDETREFMRYIIDGANRMQQLIADLLAFSRVGTRTRPFALVDIADVVRATLINLKVAIEESEAIISFDPLPKILGDNVQMVQLFQNLIGNAIKFRGRATPQVHIGVGEEGERWLFSVQDNGIGIEPEYHSRIFVIFQRLHGRDEYPGTGIGLAISKKIVERHGGSLWLESSPGAGTTFFFSIPKAPEAA